MGDAPLIFPAKRRSSRHVVEEKKVEVLAVQGVPASTSASTPTYCPCEHVLEFKQKHGFKNLQKWIAQRGARCATEAVHKCVLCGGSSGRLYACLLCAAVCCWDPVSVSLSVTGPGPHAFVHARSFPGHHLAIDVQRAELFCCICKDQVYDPDLDLAVLCAQALSSADGTSHSPMILSRESMKSPCVPHFSNRPYVPNGSPHIHHTGPQTRSKKRTLEAQNHPCMPSPAAGQCLVKKRFATASKRDEDDLLGLRGLNNLGNTCFMNSILQALLHAPPMRSYFLEGQHDRTMCRETLCLRCEMDIIYSAVYSGDRSPYSPARFLYSWWQHAANLSGYKQQDAHEFFISIIDGIHGNVEAKKSAGNDGECGCIAHRSFSGLLRSDVTCLECGFSSTAYDPCIDISLDLEPLGSIISNGTGSCSNHHQMAALNWTTLYGCLDRFTRLEKLGLDQKFYCENCKIPQESVKQMSLCKLPQVLCLHIKRFEHSHVRNMSKKIDRYVQFPFNLDMAPYMSSCIVRLRHGNRLGFFDGEQTSPAEYELFAVVSHTGKLDSGHYITYLHLGLYWYRCNDSWISRVSNDVVRTTQAYMLYYVRKAFISH